MNLPKTLTINQKTYWSEKKLRSFLSTIQVDHFYQTTTSNKMLLWHEKLVRYVSITDFEQYINDLYCYLCETTLGFTVDYKLNFVKEKSLFYITFETNKKWTAKLAIQQKLCEAWKSILHNHCYQQGLTNISFKIILVNKEPTKPKKKTAKITNNQLMQNIKVLCKKVKQTKQPQKTTLLDADQRALVHNLIHQYSFLTSKSVGKNKNAREIIISYKKPKQANKPSEPVS